MLGVRARFPKAWSARSVSTMITTTLGRSAAWPSATLVEPGEHAGRGARGLEELAARRGRVTRRSLAARRRTTAARLAPPHGYQPYMDRNEFRHELAQQLRVDSVRASAAAGSGHPTSSMSAAELMAVLLDGHLRLDPDRPDDPARDHLIFSKGHASPALLRLPEGGRRDRRRGAADRSASWAAGSRATPTPVLPWVDVATGSLGQGLPVGGRPRADREAARPRRRSRVWVLCGDSELAEGSIWEAFDHASFWELDNLIAIVDVNRLGQTGETMHGWDLDAYAERARSFGWEAIEVDGHDVAAIEEAYAAPSAPRAAPPSCWPAPEGRRRRRGGGPARQARQAARRRPSRRSRSWAASATSQVRLTAPEPTPSAHRFEAPGGERPRYETRRRGGHPQGLRRGAQVRSATPAATWSRSTARSPTRPTASIFRDAHPDRFFEMYIAEQQLVAAAVGDAAARLAAVRLDVRRVPHARVRLRAHGRRQPGEHPAVRLARRRLDRRGRAVADGPRGPGRVPGGALEHRALPVATPTRRCGWSS